MTDSRRDFFKKSMFFALGFSFFIRKSYANVIRFGGINELSLKKNGKQVVKVNGNIMYGDLSPVKNATIEIWHNNSEKNLDSFDYKGKMISDLEGNYSFETDFPEKHFEGKFLKTRRIYFKIKDQNGDELLTKLHFGFDGKAFVDNFHVNNVPDKFKLILPKTKFEEDLYTVRFDIYLNTKVATNFA